jgi:hypothetical protein
MSSRGNVGRYNPFPFRVDAAHGDLYNPLPFPLDPEPGQLAGEHLRGPDPY